MRRLALAFMALGGTLSGCGEGGTPPSVDVVRVITATEGPSPDPDGYALVIDGGGRQAIGTTDTVDVLAPGAPEHTLGLEGIAPNCSPADNATRTVLSVADTAAVEFRISCRAEAGTLRVTTLTTGTDVDPNGYIVEVDGTQYGAVDVTGDYTIGVPTGTHTVTLAGVTPNCRPATEEPPTPAVVSGSTALVTFSLTCAEAPPAGPGHEIAFVSDRAPDPLHGVVDRIYVMNDDGTGLRALPPRITNSHRSLAWLPDGSQLGFIGIPENMDDFEPVDLDVLDIGTGAFRTLRTEAFVGGPVWSPDGSKLAYAQDLEPFPDAEGEGRLQVFIADPDGSNARQLGPRNISRVDPTWAPDGARLAFSRFGPGVRDIAISAVDGSDEAPLPTPLPADILSIGLAWSPDGSRLAFAGRVGESFTSCIFVMNTDGTGLTRLTDCRGLEGESSPVWSPDGSKLAFESDRDGNSEIYVMNADGSDQTRLTNDPSRDSNPAWRP